MKLLIIAAMLVVLALSGCVTIDTTSDIIDETACDLGGGIWMDDTANCCPKGCPMDEPHDASDALIERCEICWV